MSAQVSVAGALATVGLTLDAVLELGGSVLAAGPAYLVGSLAGGLGNRGSDVDIHLLVPDISKPSPPFLLFHGDTPVDIEHYPDTMPGAMVEAAKRGPVRELPVGAVSLGPAPGRRTRRTVARWLTAVPLHDGQDPVFGEADRRTVLPSLVRASLDQVLVMWSTALLAVSADAEAAGYLWARAGREVLELRCRGRGDVLTGEKWLPDRAVRLGFDPDHVRAHYRARTEAEFRALLADTGLAEWDPWRVTTLRAADGRDRVRLGREEFTLTSHGRLLADPIDADGDVSEVVGAHPLVRLLSAVRDGELALTVSDDALGALCKVPHD